MVRCGVVRCGEVWYGMVCCVLCGVVSGGRRSREKEKEDRRGSHPKKQNLHQGVRKKTFLCL